jgi:hypothetical protein
MGADEDAPLQLELGLGLAPTLGAPGPAAANGQLTPGTATVGQPEDGRPGPATEATAPDGPAGLDRQAELGVSAGLDRQAELSGPDDSIWPTDLIGPAGLDRQAQPGGPAGLDRQAGPGGPAGLDRQAGSGGQAELNGQAGVAGQAGAAHGGGRLPEPELLVIPARQVGGSAGQGGQLTVPAQRRGQLGQPSQPGQPDRQAGTVARVPHRTRLTGQANLDPAANSRFLLRVGRQAALFASPRPSTSTLTPIPAAAAASCRPAGHWPSGPTPSRWSASWTATSRR